MKSVSNPSGNPAPNLNKIKMTVIQTAPAGVVNYETIFHFTQVGDLVSAEYQGGKILRGFLVGTNQDSRVHFSYCQIQTDGKLDHGHSECDLELSAEGKLRMVEHFEWGSRQGESGINIFEEVP